MYDGDRSSSSSAGTAGSSSGVAPGKRTMTAQLAPRAVVQASAALGHDFSNVGMHEDGQADALGTRAFARGDDVHFARGAYQPDTQDGAALIGHELAHVAQQREGRVPVQGQRGGVAVNVDPALEAEADARGAEVAQGFDLDAFLDFDSGRRGAVAAPVAQGEDLAPEAEPEAAEPEAEPGAEPEAEPSGASLDDIEGDGTLDNVDALIARVGESADLAAASLATYGEAGAFSIHIDGARRLPVYLRATIAQLEGTANLDDDGEVAFDPELHDAFLDAEERCEVAITVLGDVELLGRAPEIKAVGALMAQLGELGLDTLAGLAIRADSGRKQMERVVAMFGQHQAMMDKYLVSACKDLIGIVPGGIAKTDWTKGYDNLRKAAQTFSDGWSYYGQWDKVLNPPKSTFDTVKTVVSFGLTAAKPFAELMGEEVKGVLAELTMMIKIAQAYTHIGLAAGELVAMNEMIGAAQQIQTEYGPLITWMTEHEAEIAMWGRFCTALSGGVAAADRVLDEAEARIDASVTAWDGLYR